MKFLMNLQKYKVYYSIFALKLLDNSRYVY